jgi:hypothetical protein
MNDWLLHMTDDEKRLSERNELCSFATGYLYGCLVMIQSSGAASDILQNQISERLKLVRPMIQKIYQLGESAPDPKP